VIRRPCPSRQLGGMPANCDPQVMMCHAPLGWGSQLRESLSWLIGSAVLLGAVFARSLAAIPAVALAPHVTPPAALHGGRGVRCRRGSNFTYAEATWTHGSAIGSAPIRAPLQQWAAFRGLLFPTNAKVAVIKACLGEPQVNRTYAEMAAHYGTAVLRPDRRPRDKAKVQVAVLIVGILARLRHRRFYNLAELSGDRRAAQAAQRGATNPPARRHQAAAARRGATPKAGAEQPLRSDQRRQSNGNAVAGERPSRGGGKPSVRPPQDPFSSLSNRQSCGSAWSRNLMPSILAKHI
jgi:hypothetical protein